MFTKTLLLTLSAAAFLSAPVPAFAGTAQTGEDVQLSASDLAFLNGLSQPSSGTDKKTGGSDVINSTDNKFVDPFAVGTDSPIKAAAPTPVGEGADKPKYVYKGWNETRLRRPIQDNRVDDGYVQGLMQRGSQ